MNLHYQRWSVDRLEQLWWYGCQCEGSGKHGRWRWLWFRVRWRLGWRPS